MMQLRDFSGVKEGTMKIESHSDTRSSGRRSEWGDPVFDVYLQELRELVEGLEELLRNQRSNSPLSRSATRLLSLCEHLCEGSREVVYSIDKISVCNAQRLKDVFSRAVAAMGAVKLSDTGRQERIESYRTHVAIRLEDLIETLAAIPSARVDGMEEQSSREC